MPSPLPTNIHLCSHRRSVILCAENTELVPPTLLPSLPPTSWPGLTRPSATRTNLQTMQSQSATGSSPAMTCLRAARQQLGSLVLPTEIISLSLVPSHCRTLHVRSWRSHCAAIGTLNRECAALNNLRPVPAERARFQYRDECLLCHFFLSLCAPASIVSHPAHTRPVARITPCTIRH